MIDLHAAQRTARELPYLLEALSGARRLLDIGCGPAWTTIELAKRLPLDMLYLMDGALGPRVMGFQPDTEAWFGTSVTEQNAIEAGIPFQLVTPDPTATFAVDAIVSLLSWGHHYPTYVYRDLALRSLPIGGTLILDLRKGQNGLEEVRTAGFENLRVLDETPRMHRHLFIKVAG